MIQPWNIVLRAAVFGGITLLSAGMAHASMDVTLDSAVTTLSETLFTYSISTAQNDVIRNGDFFRIYDFGGYVAGSITAPTGWDTSVSFSDPTPPPNVLLTYGDDPLLANLSFTYTGTTDIVGPITLSGFSAKSDSFNGTYAIKDFTSRVGTTAGGNADTVGANAVAPAAAPVPELSSVIGLGTLVGLSGLSLLRQRRQRA